MWVVFGCYLVSILGCSPAWFGFTLGYRWVFCFLCGLMYCFYGGSILFYLGLIVFFLRFQIVFFRVVCSICFLIWAWIVVLSPIGVLCGCDFGFCDWFCLGFMFGFILVSIWPLVGFDSGLIWVVFGFESGVIRYLVGFCLEFNCVLFGFYVGFDLGFSCVIFGVCCWFYVWFLVWFRFYLGFYLRFSWVLLGF